MASQRQLEMLHDLEAAAAAIEFEKPEKVSIGLICERAGVIPQSFSQLVNVLTERKEWDLLSRMKCAFERAGKVPKWLESVKVLSSASKRSEPDLPPTGAERRAQIVNLAIEAATPDESDPVLSAVTTIVKTLAPLSHTSRLRALSTSSVFFGVEMGG